MKVRVHVTLRACPLWQILGAILGSAAPASQYVACPECGGRRVKPLPKPDSVDRIATVPWSRLHHWLGGALYDCPLCRLQFYDARKQIDVKVIAR